MTNKPQNKRLVKKRQTATKSPIHFNELLTFGASTDFG